MYGCEGDVTIKLNQFPCYCLKVNATSKSIFSPILLVPLPWLWYYVMFIYRES